MRRRLFTLLSATSLTLFVATVAIWVRSYWVSDGVLVPLSSVPAPRTAQTPVGYAGTVDTRVNTTITVASPPGVLYVLWQRRTQTAVNPSFRYASRPAEPANESNDWNGATSRWRAAGFLWTRRDVPYTKVRFHVPLWAIAAPAGVLPAVWLRRRLVMRARARRAKAGLCPGCGYDVRATPGRCPECGTVPAAAAEAPKPATS